MLLLSNSVRPKPFPEQSRAEPRSREFKDGNSVSGNAVIRTNFSDLRRLHVDRTCHVRRCPWVCSKVSLGNFLMHRIVCAVYPLLPRPQHRHATLLLMISKPPRIRTTYAYRGWRHFLSLSFPTIFVSLCNFSLVWARLRRLCSPRSGCGGTSLSSG